MKPEVEKHINNILTEFSLNLDIEKAFYFGMAVSYYNTSNLLKFNKDTYKCFVDSIISVNNDCSNMFRKILEIENDTFNWDEFVKDVFE